MAASATEPMECGAGDRATAPTQAPFMALQSHDGAGAPSQYAILPQTIFVPGQAIVAPLQGENQYCTLKNIAVEKKIGHGQFSVVYRARCKFNSAVVALKKVQVVRWC